MTIVAGIDGGGTKTRAVLADTAGRVIGAGNAGPSNYGNVSLEEVSENIKKALLNAFEHTGEKPEDMESIFLGMASVVSDKDRSIIRRMVEGYEFMQPKHIGVDHDIRISLAGGLGGREGIALIVGTGSSCYGRRVDGRDWMAGGWGHILDDRGSAYDLGRQALIAVVRAADGRGQDTKLLPLIMDRLDIGNITEIMQKIYMNGSGNQGMNKKEIASLAPIVTHAASNGDKVAKKIIQNGMKELTLMVRAVAKKLDFMPDEVPLVTSGGVINGSSLLKNELYKTLRVSLSECKIYESRLSPVLGSVLLALKILGIDTNKKIIKKLNQ